MYMLACVIAVLHFDDDNVIQTELILMNLNQQLLHLMIVLTYWQPTPNYYSLMNMPL